MYEPDHDLAFLATGLDVLESFLITDDIFTAMGGDLPMLTIGGLLLAIRRIKAVGYGARTNANLMRLETIRTKWRSAWTLKAEREIRARYYQWKDYLQETLEKGEVAYYSQQVTWRVMLKLLQEEIDPVLWEKHKLKELDSIHKNTWRTGRFVWDPILIPGFPEGEYWFLYGEMKIA